MTMTTEKGPKQTVGDVKLLLTALALAATLGGWAALSQSDLAASADRSFSPAEAAPPASRPVRPGLRSVALPPNAPAPIAMTRSSR